ncbi:hypothetical protein GCM10023178_38060 [Actinomadura luteofluorescens]
MTDAAWLAERIGDRTARGIAAAMTGLIRGGEIPAGTRLPTVRGLAAELGVSPGTVADAWATLRRHRVVSAQRLEASRFVTCAWSGASGS